MKNNWRQKLHLEPEKGWLNDPNGLSFFRGEYQVYFQYSPDSASGGGDKCWGHWKSKDLLHWQFTGVVMRPDCPEDRSGVYSGSGLVKDGLLYLFYTGNVKEEGDHDYITSGRGANEILVTTEDGHHVSGKRVLLRNADYPDYCSCHVRDPKVWEEDGHYRMVLGARTLEDTGCVLFYTSDDLTEWSFEGRAAIPDFGFMWECPDVFDVGIHRYLGISPQGLPHEEYRFQNVYSSGYFLYDDGLKRESFEEWDHGFDFYAPQTFEAPDGRRLLIGWMGIGDIPYTNPTTALGWQHCLTVFRELTEGKDGCIIQQPAREYEALRGKEQRFTGDGELTACLPFELLGEADGDFAITFGDYLRLEYRQNSGTKPSGEDSSVDGPGVFTLEFTDDKVGGGRTVRKVRMAACPSIRILADTSSLEIYLNGGEKVMGTRFYPEELEVKLQTENLCGIVYALEGMEVIPAESALEQEAAADGTGAAVGNGGV